MADNPIVEIISRFEEVQHLFNAEKHDLEKKVSDLEKQRFQFSQDMEKDGTNAEIRTRLLNTERDLNECKKLLNAKQKEYANNIRELRSGFIKAHNDLVDQLKKKLKKIEKEKDILRSELIPETEKKLESLIEKKRKLDIEIINTITKISEFEKEGEEWLQKM